MKTVSLSKAFDGVDIVVITAITYQAPRAYKIAKAAKKRGMTVIMGGIHASVIPYEVQQFVDTVCVQEAEEVWPQICADYDRGELKPIYEGGQLQLGVLGDKFPDREFHAPEIRLQVFIDHYDTRLSLALRVLLCADLPEQVPWSPCRRRLERDGIDQLQGIDVRRR